MTEGWSEDLQAGLACLRSGGVLLYPTDTIWGLGCDPLDAQAVARVYALKDRPADKSLILLASDIAQIEAIVGALPVAAQEEMDRRNGRPTTIIYPEVGEVYRGIASTDHSLAIRLTDDPFCVALIHLFGRPITSTSANLSGHPFGGSFADIHPQIVEGAGYVVHWRRQEQVAAAPSRIIKLGADGKVQVVRP